MKTIQNFLVNASIKVRFASAFLALIAVALLVLICMEPFALIFIGICASLLLLVWAICTFMDAVDEYRYRRR